MPLRGRWTASLIHHLGNRGTARFNALQRALTGISPKVLIERLRALERHRLVWREATEDVPPGVARTSILLINIMTIRRSTPTWIDASLADTGTLTTSAPRWIEHELHLDSKILRHHDAHMRTTVTLDPEVERLLKEVMRRDGQSFKQALNQAILSGLAANGADTDEAAFEINASPLTLRAGLDPGHLNQLNDDFEAEQFVKLTTQLREVKARQSQSGDA